MGLRKEDANADKRRKVRNEGKPRKKLKKKEFQGKQRQKSNRASPNFSGTKKDKSKEKEK